VITWSDLATRFKALRRFVAEPRYSGAVNFLRDLQLQTERGDFLVVVEVPKGSTVKLKYNPGIGAFEWSRALRKGMSFPHDFGFFPRTVAGDRDAIDAMVLSDTGSYPGVVVPSRIVGSLRVTQDRGVGARRNDRVFVVPVNEHRWSELRNVTELSKRHLDELLEFFRSSLVLTGKKVKFEGFADAEEATEHVLEGAHRF